MLPASYVTAVQVGDLSDLGDDDDDDDDDDDKTFFRMVDGRQVRNLIVFHFFLLLII